MARMTENYQLRHSRPYKGAAMMAPEPVGGQVAPVVLVVEDDAALVSMLQDVLPPAGYTMVHAADGLAGLACIQAGGVDLVLLDLALPQLSGLVGRRLEVPPF
jgi:PleD family two-component response regulator